MDIHPLSAARFTADLVRNDPAAKAAYLQYCRQTQLPQHASAEARERSDRLYSSTLLTFSATGVPSFSTKTLYAATVGQSSTDFSKAGITLLQTNMRQASVIATGRAFHCQAQAFDITIYDSNSQASIDIAQAILTVIGSVTAQLQTNGQTVEDIGPIWPLMLAGPIVGGALGNLSGGNQTGIAGVSNQNGPWYHPLNPGLDLPGGRQFGIKLDMPDGAPTLGAALDGVKLQLRHTYIGQSYTTITG